MAQFEVELGDKVSKPAGDAKGSLDSLISSFSECGSSSDSAKGMISSFTDQLKQLGPEGAAVAAIITVVTTVVLGLADALYQGAKAAISFSQEKDHMRAVFDALGEGANAGEKTFEMLDKLAATLPYTGDQLGEMAKSLMAAGIQGQALEDDIRGVAAATALMGKTGGAAADKMFKQLAEGGAAADKMVKAIQSGGPKSAKLLADMGLQSADLAKALGMTPEQFAKAKLGADKLGDALQKALVQKGAGALENMSLTWTSIWAKVQEGVGDVFEDLGNVVRPFMEEVKSLFSEFNKGSATMGIGKSIITAVFTTVFSAAAKVVNFIHKAFLEIGIVVLKVVTFFAPLINFFIALYSNATVVKGIIFFFKALAVILGIVLVAAFLVALPFIILGVVAWAAIALVVAGFFWLEGVISDALSAVGDLLSDAYDALSDWASGAADAAGDFISGLVDGIVSGAGMVIDAISNLASSALGAFKSILGIASPSKVMMEMGGFTAQGLASGIDEGAGGVETASRGLGMSAIDGASSGVGASSGSGPGGSGSGITIGDITITITGAAGNAMELTEEAVTAIFERIALEQGLVT